MSECGEDMGEHELTDEQLLAALDRDDAYQVVRVLAQKGIGSTELVRLPGETLRIRKRIPLEVANERAWTKLMDLRDPLLPRVREVYRLPDVLVVICDYIEGMPLSELVPAVGRLEPSEAVRRIRELCHAAGVLHAHDIVHRDIAPSNVVISASGTHLIDLGNARTHDEGARRDTTLLGTYGFASPEQYGFAQTDARSDIYSLGRLLAYMLTGVLPSTTDFDAAFADDRLVPPALRAVIDMACAFEPSARFQNVDALAAAAAGALAADESAPSPRQAADSVPTPHQDDVPTRSSSASRQSAASPTPAEPPRQAPEPPLSSEPPRQDGGASTASVRDSWNRPPASSFSQQKYRSYEVPVTDVPPRPHAEPPHVERGPESQQASRDDAADRRNEAQAESRTVDPGRALAPRLFPMPRDLIKFRADVAQAWSLAGPGAKVGAVSLIIFAGFWTVMFANAGFYRAPGKDPAEMAGLPLFGLTCAYACMALGLELCRFVLRAGWYATPARWQYLLKRIGGCVLVAVIGLVASVFLTLLVQPHPSTTT